MLVSVAIEVVQIRIFANQEVSGMSDIVSVAFVRDVRIPPRQELQNRVWSKAAKVVPQSGKVMSIVLTNNGIMLSDEGVTRLYPWHIIEYVEYADVKKDKP